MSQQSPPRRPGSPSNPGSPSGSGSNTVSPQHVLDVNNRLQAADLSNENRQQLEKRLLAMQRSPGFSISALQICTAPAEKNISEQLSQLAAIQFRRVVVSTWIHTPSSSEQKKLKRQMALTIEESQDQEDERACNPLWDVILNDGEKRAIREAIFPAVMNANPDNYRQLIDAFRHIVSIDYPTKWPGIFGEIGRVLKSTKDFRILAVSLESLLMLFKAFEFCHVDSGRRGPLNALIEGCYPTVLAIMTKMCEINSVEAREVQRWCARLFYSGLNVAIPPHFLSKFENFAGWMETFFKILALPIPPGEPTAPEERAEWSPWKLRKWIFHSFNRLISRYGTIRKAFPQEWKPFSRQFFDTYARRMLQATFMYLGLFRKNQYVPDRLVQCLISFIDSAYRFKSIWEVLKSKMMEVLVHVIFPLLCFGPKDLQQWRDDPLEYLRSGSDLMVEIYDPRKTAIAFLHDVIKQKDADLLKPLVDFLAHVLNEFAKADASKQTLSNAGRFTGALFALGIIHDPVIKEKRLRDGLEQLLRNVVVPAMTCKFPFIRARALWAFATYSDVDFRDESILSTALAKVLQLMTDNELPVKVEASMALRTFIEFDVCRPAIRSNLPMLIDRIFKLFNVLDHDELVQCLEAIIIRFEKEIHPFANSMITRFAKEFHRLMQSVEDNDDDMTAMAVDEILRAVIALLAAVRKHPDIYPQVEAPALSIVRRVLTQDCIDFVDHGVKIISLLTYFPDRISDAVWNFYKPLIQIYRTWGHDFLAEIIPVWDNFITNDRETFLSPNNTYLDETMRVIEQCFKGKGNFSGKEYDCAEAAKLAEVLMQSCREKIDKYMPGMINMIVARLQTIRNKGVNVLLLTALSNCFFYNPFLTISALEKKKCTKQVLQLWVSREPMMKKLYDMKLMVIGISAIFRLPLDKAPVDLQQALPHLLRTCLKVLTKMNTILSDRRQRKAQKKMLSEKLPSQTITGADQDSEDEIDGDDRHGIEDLTLAEIRDLQAETEARINGNIDDSDSDSSSSDGDDDYEPADSDEDLEKEPAIENLVDQTDELVYFVSSLKEFSQRLPAIYKKLHDTTLNPDQQETLRNCIKEAQSRREDNR